VAHQVEVIREQAKLSPLGLLNLHPDEPGGVKTAYDVAGCDAAVGGLISLTILTLLVIPQST